MKPIKEEIKEEIATINQQVTVETKNQLRDLCRINNVSAKVLFPYLLSLVKQKELDKLKKRY